MQRDDVDPLYLLALWWEAESQWTPVEGYPKECPSCRDWRSSRQYDDQNGAADTDSRGALIRHIAGVIKNIDEPHRTALYMVARNHATGASVWASARLPADPQARAEVVAEAVELFTMAV
jgi:hypothetical protein